MTPPSCMFAVCRSGEVSRRTMSMIPGASPLSTFLRLPLAFGYFLRLASQKSRTCNEFL